MKAPLVSICIPVYNGEAYLKKCIESCLSQTFSDFEIIVCNDQSTDNSQAIIREFVLKDSRIKSFTNSNNLGLVGNWNATLNHATGKYIKWLFQDDWMEPNALEVFITAAQQGYDFIVSMRNFILEESNSKDQNYYKNEVVKLENHFDKDSAGHYFSSQQIAGLSTDNIALNFIGEPSLTFFKKGLIDTIGLYDPKFHQICDLEFNLRLAGVAGVYVINQPLCCFAVHEQSTTSKNLEEKYFQLRFIEQAYFAFKLLNDKSFKQLQSGFTFAGKIKLALYYNYRIHEAKRFLKKQNQNNKYTDNLMEYPQLNPNSFKHVLLSPLYFILDLVKRRL